MIVVDWGVVDGWMGLSRKCPAINACSASVEKYGSIPSQREVSFGKLERFCVNSCSHLGFLDSLESESVSIMDVRN